MLIRRRLGCRSRRHDARTRRLLFITEGSRCRAAHSVGACCRPSHEAVRCAAARERGVAR